MLFAIVWIVVLVFLANSFPSYDEIFWIASFFIPPLVLWPLLGN